MRHVISTAGAPLYLLVSAFNGGIYNASAAARAGVGVKAVQLDVALADAPFGADALASLRRALYEGEGGGAKNGGGNLRVEQYYMDSDNAVYDTMWRDLAARGELNNQDQYVDSSRVVFLPPPAQWKQKHGVAR